MRLRWDYGCSHKAIASSINISGSTASECLRRAREAKLNWPLPQNLSDKKLEALLYLSTQKVSTKTKEQRGENDWLYIHNELKRKHVTLMLLWTEYNQIHPEGLRYRQFCYCYREWAQQLDAWMRQLHKAGEKLFVDYAVDITSLIMLIFGQSVRINAGEL